VLDAAREEVMKLSLKVLVLGCLAGSMLPRALPAIEPDVSTEKRDARSNRVDSTCVQVPVTYQMTGPFTAQELEAEAVPHGKANAEWQQFVLHMRKGDKLFRYAEACCTGIIIVRRGCIVDWFQISES
jgi:hypothetical protein